MYKYMIPWGRLGTASPASQLWFTDMQRAAASSNGMDAQGSLELALAVPHAVVLPHVGSHTEARSACTSMRPYEAPHTACADGCIFCRLTRCCARGPWAGKSMRCLLLGSVTARGAALPCR